MKTAPVQRTNCVVFPKYEISIHNTVNFGCLGSGSKIGLCLIFIFDTLEYYLMIQLQNFRRVVILKYCLQDNCKFPVCNRKIKLNFYNYLHVLSVCHFWRKTGCTHSSLSQNTYTHKTKKWNNTIFYDEFVLLSKATTATY